MVEIHLEADPELANIATIPEFISAEYLAHCSALCYVSLIASAMFPCILLNTFV